MKRRSGFTLIELLVVVSIIALLIAILLPSLARAKNQAKKTACASNMHQIGIALNTYGAEYDNNLPPETGRGHENYGYGNTSNRHLYMRWGYAGVPPYMFQNGSTQTTHWRELICMDVGQVKDPRVYYCPGQSNSTWMYTKPASATTDPYSFLGPINDHSGYSYQLHIGGNPDATNKFYSGGASKNVGGFSGAAYTKLTALPKDIWLMSDKIYDVISIPHANNAGSNGLFGDAHVEFGNNAKIKTLATFPNPYSEGQTFTMIYLWEQAAAHSK
jgi:prepilin-type N-terminal cleavage/methylation domain-containing protein